MSVDTHLDMSVLDALDFSPVIPCEHRQHEQFHIKDKPAVMMVEIIRHCSSGGRATALICQYAWDKAGIMGLRCDYCSTHLTREQGWIFLSRI